MIDYESVQATLIFDGFTRFDRMDRTLVVGSNGAIRSEGPTTETQRVELTTADGIARPRLNGTWFPDGFHGTMAELLSAIAEKREAIAQCAEQPRQPRALLRRRGQRRTRRAGETGLGAAIAGGDKRLTKSAEYFTPASETMIASTIFILIIIGMFFGTLLLQVACMRWGLQWARSRRCVATSRHWDCCLFSCFADVICGSIDFLDPLCHIDQCFGPSLGYSRLRHSD